jgi:hypothetical protein
VAAIQGWWHRLNTDPQIVNHLQFVAADTERLARHSGADRTQARLAIMFDITSTWEVHFSGCRDAGSINGMQSDGMEWNGMEWNGMEWNGMEWNGMEWNGMGWDGMEWTKLISSTSFQ